MSAFPLGGRLGVRVVNGLPLFGVVFSMGPPTRHTRRLPAVIGSALFAMSIVPSAVARSSQMAVTPSANPFRIGRPLVIPHGGGDGEYPENTMLAWERSMAQGGDVVDIDVSMTADNIPIAFHDGTLERTTNGHGRVATSTYAELAKLDAGWNFKLKGKYPYRGKNVHIPTIESGPAKIPGFTGDAGRERSAHLGGDFVVQVAHEA